MHLPKSRPESSKGAIHRPGRREAGQQHGVHCGKGPGPSDLDADKKNNDPENLVIACQRCNMARAVALKFTKGLTDDRLGKFLKTIIAHHAITKKSQV